MHILLVEDDRSIQTVLRYALTQAGHILTQAFTLAEARATLATESIDFVLLDVVLPDGDGFTLGEELCVRGDIPLLFLTSRGDEQDRVKGLALGADDYVVKPFSVEELKLRIDAIARRTRHTQDLPKSSTSRLALDVAARTAAIDGRPVDLTAMEFNLIALFMRHRRQVCTREFLLDRLGHDNLDKNDRSIDAHIKRVRRKFADAGADPIKTIRGVGYKYELD